MASAIATRYANALADAVFVDKGADARAAASELRSYAEAVAGSPELSVAMNSPAVSQSKKRAVTERIAGTLAISKLIRNFLFVVIDHRRTPLLGQIAEAFESVLDERTGVVRAQVTGATELTPDEQAKVQAELSRVAGKQVRCEFSVDSALIGGVTARIGSTVYDGSVRSRLQGLRERLTA